MAFNLGDRVQEASATTGETDFALGGPPIGFQAFGDVLNDGDTTWYCAVREDEWEVGLGTFSAGTLARTEILASSNGGAKVSFSAGSKSIFATAPAELLKLLPMLQSIEPGADVTSAAKIAAAINGGASKTTPVLADRIMLLNSTAGFAAVYSTVGGLQTTLDARYYSRTEVDTIVANALASARRFGKVRVATTANITIATALNAGDLLDGVTLANGDYALVKNQTTGAQNGVYVVGATPVRAPEFDTFDKIAGSDITVMEGTANADTRWICTSNSGGTLDSTAIAWTKANISGELLIANNLSEVDPATARGNLGVQPTGNPSFTGDVSTTGNFDADGYLIGTALRLRDIDGSHLRSVYVLSNADADYDMSWSIPNGHIGVTWPSGGYTIVGHTTVQTLTNKRIAPRVGSGTTTSSLAFDPDSYDQYDLTAQAANLTLAAPTGTPTDGQRILYRVKASGGTRTLTRNAIFRAIGITPIASIPSGKTFYELAVYNAADTKWDILASAVEA